MSMEIFLVKSQQLGTDKPASSFLIVNKELTFESTYLPFFILQVKNIEPFKMFTFMLIIFWVWVLIYFFRKKDWN